jgi:hypothetical protein
MLRIRPEQLKALSAEVLERRGAKVARYVEERLRASGHDASSAAEGAARVVSAGRAYGLVSEADLLVLAELAERYALPWEASDATRWMHRRMVDPLLDDASERLALLREAVEAKERAQSRIAAARAEFLGRKTP